MLSRLPIPVLLLLWLLAMVMIFYGVALMIDQGRQNAIKACEKHHMFYVDGHCYPKEKR